MVEEVGGQGDWGLMGGSEVEGGEKGGCMVKPPRPGATSESQAGDHGDHRGHRGHHNTWTLHGKGYRLGHNDIRTLDNQDTRQPGTRSPGLQDKWTPGYQDARKPGH